MSKPWQFWIDRGGTFTDVIGRHPDGRLVTAKLLSEDPEHYPDAAVEGIRRLLGLDADVPITPALVEVVKMGTTVATNALLERKGEPLLLAITRGFGDALRIAYQNRPRLFDRRIELPELLYREVLEVDERLAADGEVITPLDPGAARAGLQRAFDAGLRAVAILLMHGYKYAAHERALAALAREIGFTQVSVSHQVSPLIKFVSRGDTTVVDAYLSPVLRRYVGQVARAMHGVRLQFMQSNGGLTDARTFQGKDSILSGPAGGIVGMARVSQAAGFDRVIGFDMGGTSTDVSHFAGEFERAFDTLVAGVRMRAPMMSIHTVAAGGGSILHFDGTRLRVGPDSAGAHPGPACYRRGGPLTVTDANVMLGRIQPAHFPRVFGPGADEPLDAEVVRRRFGELAATVSQASGREMSPEALAQGFVDIAVANMANAIKRISVQRGYDVTEYTLTTFGGAGGQHACGVADALAMPRVLSHPLAGVLSAYGMGLAQQMVMKEQSVELPLDEDGLAEGSRLLAGLADAARSELLAQGEPAESLVVSAQLLLRYDGTDTALPVRHVDGSTMDAAQAISEASFQAYRSLVYGTPGFTDYFFAATPIREIAELNIGSRPASRKATRAIEDLRAIPWSFSWGQCRLGLPGWCGFGTAIEAFVGQGPDAAARVQLLQKMHRQWPFFRTLLSNLDMVLAKSDLRIAARYCELVEDQKLARRIFSAIKAEWERTHDALSRITGEAERLQSNPALARSIEHRFPYLDPLNHLQVELMRRYRHRKEGAPENERLQRGIHLSINGVAAGLRNTG